MKKLIVAALIAASAAAGAFAQDTMKGYLVDVLCGEAGYPEGYQGKIDLTVTPEKNVVACLTMANCVETGFGIYIKGSSGKFVFHPFDKKSNDFVKRQIVDRSQGGSSAPYIEINGRAAASGVISGVTKASVSRGAPPSPKDAKSPPMSGHRM